jgi:serine protease AprX
MSFDYRFTKSGALCALVAITSALLLAAAPLAASETVLDRGRYEAANGEVFDYVKSVVDGEDRIVYTKDGEVYTADQLRQYEAANPEPKVAEQLVLEAMRAPADSKLELIVWLDQRPGAEIAREVSERYMPAVRLLSEEVRDIQRSVRPEQPFTPAQEESLRQRLGGQLLRIDAEQQAQVDARALEIEQRVSAMRRETRQRVEAAVAAPQARFRRQIEDLGGSVRGVLLMENAALVTLPADQLQLLADLPGVARLVRDIRPEPALEITVPSLGVDTGFWNDGFDGGIWDVGVIDTCVDASHTSLDHVQYLFSPNCNGNDFRTGGHGTQVTGIIASDDTTNRGLAFDVERMLIGSLNNVWADGNWMVSSAADDPEVINASFGWAIQTSDYNTNDQFFDAMIDDERVIVAIAAHNDGPGTMTLRDPSRAFNAVTVANMDNMGTEDRDDDVIWSTSGRGPTPAGRRKPDVAAPGQGVVTTMPNGGFGAFGGTSAATPVVSGGLILLTELRGSDEPMALKAALINAADAWTDGGTLNDTSDDGPVDGSEWNATYGWGYIDLWEAWFNGLDVFNDTVDDGFTPAGLDFKLYRGRLFANEKATLVWNRHLGYNGSNAPSSVESLSDLDLVAYRQSNGSQIVNAHSGANNVEQISLSTTEDVLLKVDVFGSLDPDVSVESYALATEGGFSRVDPPSFGMTANSPLFTPAGTARTFTVTMKNNGDVTAFNDTLQINLPSGFTLVSGSNPRTMPNLAPGASASASWTIRWNTCTSSGATATIGLVGKSTSYGEFLTSTGGKTVVCENLNK